MTTQSGVVYRPGRIQTLSGVQEIILKQAWAHYFKYLGYPLDFPDEDLAYRECFVASTSTSEAEDPAFPNLTRTATRNSINSSVSHKTSSTSFSKKKGLFGKKAPVLVALPTPPPDSKRMHLIESGSSFNRYEPVTEPSEQFYQVFADYYKASFEYDDDYVSDESDDDDLSLETFVTASTSLTVPEESYSPPQRTKSRIMHPNDAKKATSDKSKPPSSSTYSKQVLPTPLAPPSTSTSRRGRASGHVKPNVNISPILAKYDPKHQHDAIFTFPAADLPDNWLLRFIRARKFELDPALNMFSKSMHWRSQELSASDWVIEGDASSYLNGTNKGFVKNFTTEKSWIEGTDRQNNPVFWFQAKKHFGSDSPAAETQRYAVVTIEWCRLFLKEVNDSADTVSIVFDLTGFSLKNADYTSIKFLADVFEAHYPESLGRIFIHNAPWIFSTVWNIVKNWLDPVVASKIHFTKNYQELCGFIDSKYIPINLGGENLTGSSYAVPEPHHVDPPKPKDSNYRAMRKEHDDLRLRFLETTAKWIEATSPAVSERYLQDKIQLSVAMSNLYLKLDPYMRSPGIYDRNGSLVVGN
jgi:hypothetical protein